MSPRCKPDDPRKSKVVAASSRSSSYAPSLILLVAVFSQTGFHGLHSAPNLKRLAVSRLSKRGEQDDSPIAGDEVRDAPLLATKMEAQLSKLSLQLSRVRLIEMNPLGFEKIDMSRRGTKVVSIETLKPL